MPETFEQALSKLTVQQVDAELCRRSLYYFLQEFIHVTIKEEMVWNWHLKYICDKVQEYGERVIKREPFTHDYLIVNVPPSSSKSTIISQFFPVWLWINDPTLVVITLSHTSDLAVRHGMRSRDIMNDKKFKSYFGEIKFKRDMNNKTNYGLEAGGSRIITSVGGAITGDHGHIIIIDDALKVDESTSKVERSNANSFMKHTLPTRKKDAYICPTILVGQRLHEEDPTGMLLAEMPQLCEHICIPAQESDLIKPIELKKNYVDCLYDFQRMNHSMLEKKKIELGSYQFAGQYAQRPSPEEGGKIKKAYFKIIEPHSAPKSIKHFVADTAYTAEEKNDPSAIMTYSIVGANLYIFDVDVFRLEFLDSCKRLKENVVMNGYSNASIIKVENKATGKSLVQTIKSTTNLNIREFKCGTKDKEARVDDIISSIEAGRVYLIKGGWNDSFLDSCAVFPNGKHDEEVDLLVMACTEAFKKKGLKFY